MSVDLLRRAAALMRERAEDAQCDHPRCGDRWVHGPESLTVSNGLGRELTMVTSDTHDSAIAGHMASWDPAVALAVADWLEREAGAHVHFIDREISVFDLPGMDDAPALRVARAYLRET